MKMSTKELRQLVEDATRELEQMPDAGHWLILAYEYARSRGWIKRHRGEG